MPALTDPEVLSRIKPEVTNCPVPTVVQKLKDTVVDFFDVTKIKKITLDPIDTIALQASYPLVLPTDMQIITPESVRLNNLDLQETSENSLDTEWQELAHGYSFSYRHDISFGGLDEPTWRIATATQARYYLMDENLSLRLVAIPETVYAGSLGIIAKVSVKPIARLMSAIDDAVWDDWYDTLVAGALHRLFRMPQKPWTDFKLAAAYGATYESGRSDCRDEQQRNVTRDDRGVYHSVCYS